MTITLYHRHVIDVLKRLDAGSIHCCITSPPYWGLRDYDLPSVEWETVTYRPMAGLAEAIVQGCEVGCEHEWGEEQMPDRRGLQVGTSNTLVGPQRADARKQSKGQFCHLCHGWRGSLGLEPIPSAYIAHLVAVCREIWRVLRDDGTFWLNLGSSYATNPGNGRGGESVAGGVPHRSGQDKTKSPFKPKDLVPIPWMVAMALQADGWILRSDIIWAKGLSFCPTYAGSCMPESVRDRPTKGHEYLFLLTKRQKYFYDQEAAREASADPARTKYAHGAKMDDSRNDGDRLDFGGGNGRNLRTVWAINPGSYKEAHFATFPPTLVEPCIKAGTSERGVCLSCGAPWKRVTERSGGTIGKGWTDHNADMEQGMSQVRHPGGVGNAKDENGKSYQVVTTGWQPTCTCYRTHNQRKRQQQDAIDKALTFWQEHLDAIEHEERTQETDDDNCFNTLIIVPIITEKIATLKCAWSRRILTSNAPIFPATTLDPFGGAGTTALVSDRLGRHSIYIDANAKYLAMAEDRIRGDAPMFAQIETIGD